MTLRDKIMDKYWLEFLDYWVNYSGAVPTEGQFWHWFMSSKRQRTSKKLEDYLK